VIGLFLKSLKEHLGGVQERKLKVFLILIHLKMMEVVTRLVTTAKLGQENFVSFYPGAEE
jgi:hypothetical protein